MIVDDEPSMIETLSRYLARTPDYEVCATAYMVSEAKLLLDQSRPDLLFTDIRMPGGSGLELVKYTSEHLPDCLVVVVSGYDAFEYVRSAFVWGVEDYLLKPVSPANFSSFMQRITMKLESGRQPETAKAIEQLSSANQPDSMSGEQLVDEIEKFILTNLAEDCSIDSVCRTFAISQPLLSKLFRTHKDCSYNDFLVTLRITVAKRLLMAHPEMIIGAVASATGFADQFYFSRVFKNVVGVSPKEFRRQLG